MIYLFIRLRCVCLIIICARIQKQLDPLSSVIFLDECCKFSGNPPNPPDSISPTHNLCILVFIYGVQSQQAASLGSGIGQIVGFPGPCDGHQWPFFLIQPLMAVPISFFFKKKGRPGGDGVALSISVLLRPCSGS